MASAAVVRDDLTLGLPVWRAGLGRRLAGAAEGWAPEWYAAGCRVVRQGGTEPPSMRAGPRQRGENRAPRGKFYFLRRFTCLRA